MEPIRLDTIEEMIVDSKEGNSVIVVDDEDRESEDDFAIAAEKVTPEKMNFMPAHDRGVLCAPITEERCAELGLDMQVSSSTSIYETPFTVTVDLLERYMTGVSMYDRAMTIRVSADPKTKPPDLGHPGHVNPLHTRSRGVLHRAGHIEASVDLAKPTGLYPVTALIEITGEDGTIVRLPQLMEVARRFGLRIISVKDLIVYRLQVELIVDRGAEMSMPAQFRRFRLVPFHQKSSRMERIALIKGTWNKDRPIQVRVCSLCMTGDILGSCRCECGEQLHGAIRMVEATRKGVIAYMDQKSHGIDLIDKTVVYKLQEEGYDMVDANLYLGFDASERDCGTGAQILREIRVKKIGLMTNNPVKRVGLEACGLEIVENVEIEVKPNPYNVHYLRTKKERMEYILHFNK